MSWQADASGPIVFTFATLIFALALRRDKYLGVYSSTTAFLCTVILLVTHFQTDILAGTVVGAEAMLIMAAIVNSGSLRMLCLTAMLAASIGLLGRWSGLGAGYHFSFRHFEPNLLGALLGAGAFSWMLRRPPARRDKVQEEDDAPRVKITKE